MNNDQPIQITATRRTAPDLERFAAALLALALSRVEAEENGSHEGNAGRPEGERG